MSAAGRILVDAVNTGSGFAVSPRVALTAAHVVRDKPTESLMFSLVGASPIRVEGYQADWRQDVAVLQLAADAREAVQVGSATRGQRWWVDTQALENDPLLTGDVTVERRSIGHHDTVAEWIQLRVDQQLDDYRGYSGSPVMTEDGSAVGVLVRQVESRMQVLAGRAWEPRPAGNVLYAAPLLEAMEHFHLLNQPIAPPQRSDLSELASIGTPGDEHVYSPKAWTPGEPFSHDSGAEVDKLLFSPNGELLATTGSDLKVWIWDLAENDVRTSLEHDIRVKQLAFNGTGELLATASGKVVRVWRVSAEPELVWSQEHEQEVWSLALSPDGRMLAVAVPQGTSRIWDVQGREGSDLPEPQYRSGVAFDPEGKRLAVSSFGGQTRVWRVANGELRRPMPPHREGKSVKKVSFSLKGEWLISIVDEGRPQESFSSSKPETVWVRNAHTGAPVGCVRHGREVSDVAVSTDDRLLVTSSWDKTVQLWEIGSGKEPVVLQFEQPAIGVALSHDGAFLAVATGKSARIYDLRRKSRPERLTHEDQVSAVAFSPTGLLATASAEGVWTYQSSP